MTTTITGNDGAEFTEGTTISVTEPAPSGGDDPQAPEELREAWKREKARRQELELKVRTSAFKEAGFDTEVGVGKALDTLYDGDPTPEAIRAYAEEEYGWKPDGSPNAASTKLTEGQARIDAVTESSVPVGEKTLQQQIAEAEAAGDWSTALSLKAQLLGTTP